MEIQHLFSCRNGYAPCDCLRRLWMIRWLVDLYDMIQLELKQTADRCDALRASLALAKDAAFWLNCRWQTPKDESPRSVQTCTLEGTHVCALCRLADAHADLASKDEALRACVEALEAIVYASDQCQGHRGCGHSMEPWKKARAALARSQEAGQ